jgi:hypothetical protein
MSVNTDGKIDGIMPTGPLKTGYVGYRDFFPDIPEFGAEYDADRMSTVFDPSGSFQSDRDIVNMLATAYPNESAEQIADRLQSLTANTAMARQFGDAAPDPYSQLTTAPPVTPPVTPPAAQTDESLLDSILGGAKDATTAVAGVIDTGLKQLGDLIGMGDPSLVVLNPTNPSGTVVFGTPQGNTTPTIIGNMPKSGAPVGVITGIPALDNILSGVFNQRGQGGASVEEIIRGVVLDQIGKETGYPAAGVAGAIGGGLDGDLNKVIEGVNKVVLQIDKKIEEQDKVDPIAGVKGPSPDGQVGPQQPKVTPDTGTPPKVPPDSVDIVLDDGPKNSGNTVLSGGDLTLEDLDEGDPVITMAPEPDKVVSVGATSPATPGVPTPAPSQGMRMESTEKAGLAEINNTFDPSLTFVENLMRVLSGKDDTKSEASYYSGGKVAPYAGVDEIIRLLRG